MDGELSYILNNISLKIAWMEDMLTVSTKIVFILKLTFNSELLFNYYQWATKGGCCLYFLTI